MARGGLCRSTSPVCKLRVLILLTHVADAIVINACAHTNNSIRLVIIRLLTSHGHESCPILIFLYCFVKDTRFDSRAAVDSVALAVPTQMSTRNATVRP